MPRSRVDRVLHTHGRGPRIASLVIALLGLIILVWFLSPTERRRRSLMEEVALGADTTEVIRMLGPPVRCPPKYTEQVRASFPEEWAPRQVETALSRMDYATRHRWVYPVNSRKPLGCNAREAHTEIGVGADGRVLWAVDVTGRTPIRVPDEYTPSGAGS
ncbi:MAG: hypothetical protein KY464_13275 [Gemmatimonadetes bacterium]|nr:hypothetical protein [Gemmatimonadota bacterium]